jgi:hypothetical protein
MKVTLDERQVAMVSYTLRDHLRSTQEQIQDHDDCELGEPCTFAKQKYPCYSTLMQLHEEAAILASTLYQLEVVQNSNPVPGDPIQQLGKLLNESGRHDEGTTTSFEIPDKLISDIDAVKHVPSITPDPEIDPALREKLHPESDIAKRERLSHELDVATGWPHDDEPAKRDEVYIAPWPEEGYEDKGVVRTQADIDRLNEKTQLIHPIKPESTEAIHSAEERRSFLDRFSKPK